MKDTQNECNDREQTKGIAMQAMAGELRKLSLLEESARKKLLELRREGASLQNQAAQLESDLSDPIVQKVLRVLSPL